MNIYFLISDIFHCQTYFAMQVYWKFIRAQNIYKYIYQQSCEIF